MSDPYELPPRAPFERSDLGQFAIVPVWTLSVGLTGGEFKVWVSLLSWVNQDSREAWPSVKEMAARADVTERMAALALAKFRTLGMMRSEQWRRADNSIGGNHYQVLLTDPRYRAPAPSAAGNGSSAPPQTPLPAALGAAPYVPSVAAEWFGGTEQLVTTP